MVIGVLASAVVLQTAYLNLDNYFGLYEQRAGNPGDFFVVSQARRNRIIELMKHYTVYTDLFYAEWGWPQSMEYEARRLGFKADRIVQGPAPAIKEKFAAAEPPAAIYLDSGELE